MSDGCSFSREGLREAGFSGFLTFQTIRDTSFSSVPDAPGIYVVLRPREEPPSFLATNPGGRHKGRDPTVDVGELQSKWIKACDAIYIGKGNRLRTRLRQFANFGSGKPVGHWGGRYIWQLVGSESLVVAWRQSESQETAAGVETELLHEFSKEHEGRLPFANLRR